MEEQGDLRSGEDGTEGSAGFPQLSLGNAHPGPRGPSPREAEGRLSRDAGVLWGSRDGVGTLQAREGTWAPREPLGKPEVWQQGLLLPPQAPATGPGPARQGPG